MKKFIFGLFALALFVSTAPTTVQADTMTEDICYDANGNQIDCATGQVMGQPKKKRKKR